MAVDVLRGNCIGGWLSDGIYSVLSNLKLCLGLVLLHNR